MANPWGANLGVGSSWADDEPNSQAPAPAAALFGNEEAFPTLGAAVAKGPSGKKGKKNKGVTMDLGTFQRQGVSRSSIGPDVNALRMTLPTAPTGGSRPEYGGHGRGYGGDGGGGFRDREHREERRPRREPEDLGPSKADEVDDWGREKKHVPGSDRGGYGGAFGGRAGFRDREGDERPPRRGGFDHSGPSRADDADDWGRKGGPPPSDERRDRGGFGGFRGRDFRDGHEGGPRDRDAHREPREYVPSKADEADSWGAGKKFQPSEQGNTFSGRRNSEREGRRSGFGFGAGADDGDKWSRKPQEKPADAQAQPVGERKRLNLQPRSKPLGSAAEEAPRSSIFGAARPREQVLAEQGRDYRKEEMMLEHRAVDRKETEEERKLMAEIEVLRRRVVDGEADHPVDGVATSNTAYDALALAAEDPEGEGEGEEAAPAHAANEDEEDAGRGEAAGAITVKKLLEEKEAEFLRLQAQLDDEVRYVKERGRGKQQDEGQEGADEHRRESGGKGEDGGFREVAGRGARGGEKAAQAENGRPGTGGEGRQSATSRAPPRREDDGDRW